MRRAALMFETTPPASARRSRPVSRTASRARADAGAFDHALRQVGELLVRDSASGSSPERRRTPWPGRVVSSTPSRTVNPRQQRIVLVGDRRGIVGQRHHLALVFQLPHVEEAGHVLEEDAERVARACDAATRVSRPSRNVEMVDDRPSPTPSMVRTASGALPALHAAADAWASW